MNKSQLSKYAILLTPLFLGWSFDFLFVDKPFGINFPIFISLLLIGGFGLAKLRNKPPARIVTALVIPIIVFSVFTVFRLEPFTHFFNVLFILLCLVILIISFRGGRWSLYSVSDFVEKIFTYSFFVFTKPFQMLAQQGSAAPEDTGTGIKKIWMSVLRGVLIALPILFVLTILLSSADEIFKANISNLFSFLSWEKLIESSFRTILVLFLSVFIAVTYIFAHERSDDHALRGLEKPGIPAFVGQIESLVIISLINVLFLAFVIVQFQYLFGGLANIHVDGFTYSEYARKGFGELSAVAGLSLILLQVAHSVARADSAKLRPAQKVLSVLLVSQLMVILFSAYQRLSLYESVYGFSRLRTYTHIFLVWIGLLLLAVIILELKQRSRLFPLAVILATLGFGLSINILNVDARIVEWNVNQARLSGELDIEYISGLTLDAMPALVSEFHEAETKAQKDLISAAILCYEDNLHDRQNQNLPWQGTSFAWDRGLKALNAVKPELSAYSIQTDEEYRTSVEIDGNLYACSLPKSD